MHVNRRTSRLDDGKDVQRVYLNSARSIACLAYYLAYHLPLWRFLLTLEAKALDQICGLFRGCCIPILSVSIIQAYTRPENAAAPHVSVKPSPSRHSGPIRRDIRATMPPPPHPRLAPLHCKSAHRVQDNVAYFQRRMVRVTDLLGRSRQTWLLPSRSLQYHARVIVSVTSYQAREQRSEASKSPEDDIS